MSETKNKSKKPSSKAELITFIEDVKRQWMSTIDALVDPLMIVKKDYTISKANLAMAKAAKLEIKEILGKKCHQVFAGRKSPCTGCKMSKAVSSSKAQQFELAEARKDEFFEVSSQPLFNSEGELDGIVQVYRDRTEAKQLREQLLQSEKLSSIGLLAGGVAHEINNPLGGILVFSQMLMRELDPKDPHYNDVKEILHATERCKAIVESLLDFARTNPANRESKTALISITDAAKTALRFGRVAIPQHLVEIEEEWVDDGVQINADRNKLIQLFLNLIQNAAQAMPDGGVLTLRSFENTKNESTWVTYEIQDTGVGIPEEHLKKIFDPFFTTKEPGEGTGLGLAICYGIVNDLGGEMRVISEVNSGTKFSICFPIVAGQKKTA